MTTLHSNYGVEGLQSISIRLTSVEETLRQLLLDVAQYTAASPSSIQTDSQVSLPSQLAQEPTVLRFTGGWVRDKLLGQESHDIDVAINNMTGYQFGLRMQEYLSQPGNLGKYGLEDDPETDDPRKLVGGLHKIEANPEKSKHLETVTTRILGLDIDLVNLRKETYTDDSRNPQMEFGTPEEDALRRDATINAMFYNLNTLQVEDFTGRGFQDMARKVISTPLEPYQTFKDDPLRILRLIRFASRLGYSIDPAATESMKDADIKAALRVKISRERVGIELEKMLRGPDPLGALQMIDSAGLYRTVFSDPASTDDAFEPEVDTWEPMLRSSADFLSGRVPLSKLLIRDSEARYVAWTLACLIPYRSAPQPQGLPNRRAPQPVAATVAREGFRATNKIFDVLVAAIKNASSIASMALSVGTRRGVADVAKDREEIGMAIRQWGSTWRLQAAYALMASIADEPSQATDLLNTYETFLQRATELKISEAWSFRPLLDGKQLAKAIGVPPGPWMKDALEVVMAWQLRNPDKRTAAEAIEEIKKTASNGELSADLVKHFLTLTIRPLFIKTQPTSVTSQGRKATANTAPRKIDILLDDAANKPWKKKDTHAFEILELCIRHLDAGSVETFWHLLLPPLLTILDDTSTEIKARGCYLLTLFLERVPEGLIYKTGTFPVLHDSILPCFGYLPSLTPEPESAALLTAAFPAMVQLHNTKFREYQDYASVENLHAMLRECIFAPHAHCPETVSITLVLLGSMPWILDKLGFHSARHLKHSLPMLNEILCNPFAPASPQLLVATVKALQSVVRNGWPRITECRGEVLKGLCVSWTNVVDDGREGFDDFRTEARTCVDMLRHIVKEKVDWDAEVAMLVKADPRVNGLLN